MVQAGPSLNNDKRQLLSHYNHKTFANRDKTSAQGIKFPSNGKKFFAQEAGTYVGQINDQGVPHGYGIWYSKVKPGKIFETCQAGSNGKKKGHWDKGIAWGSFIKK